jgi:predicted ATPase
MAFIDSLHVENYRSLRSVDVRFEPLTIFVGPNGSGKSNVLAALQPRLGVPREHTWRREGGPVRRRFTGSIAFIEEIAVGQSTRHQWQYLRLHLDVGRLRSVNQLQEIRALNPDGFNLANLFATLPRQTRGAVAAQLCELVPLYSDVNTRPSSDGHHRLVFQDRWARSVWFEPDEVSDGTMVVLALLTLAHLDPAPDIIAIEEPEHALHPYLIGQVVGLLRDLASGRLGPKAVQVVVATHSAELLEFAEPQEVRFVSRSEVDGSTVVRPADLTTEEWQSAYREYAESLGNLWLSGNLGGVPGAPEH